MWFLSSSTLFTCYVKAYSSIKGRLRHLPPSSSLIVALALRQLGFNAMNSLFHLLSVTLARFQELQVNLNATAPPIQLPVFSQTGIYCTRARARMNTRTRARAHTHTHTHTHTHKGSTFFWDMALPHWVVGARLRTPHPQHHSRDVSSNIHTA